MSPACAVRRRGLPTAYLFLLSCFSSCLRTRTRRNDMSGRTTALIAAGMVLWMISLGTYEAGTAQKDIRQLPSCATLQEKQFLLALLKNGHGNWRIVQFKNNQFKNCASEDVTDLVEKCDVVPTNCPEGGQKTKIISFLKEKYSPVTDDRLANPEPHNWLQIRGNYQGWMHSQGNRLNIGSAQPRANRYCLPRAYL